MTVSQTDMPLTNGDGSFTATSAIKNTYGLITIS